MNALLLKLDEVYELLRDVERARASAVRFALEDKRGHADAQVHLMNGYLDVVVLRGIEAARLVGQNRGVEHAG